MTKGDCVLQEETTEEKTQLKDIVNLDDIIHTPARLALMMFLLPREKAVFTEIQNALELTAGNLSSHIKKLEANQFIEVQKAFIKAKPTTIIYITAKGLKAMQQYATLVSDVLGNMLKKIE